jgi:hypothetical protein
VAEVRHLKPDVGPVGIAERAGIAAAVALDQPVVVHVAPLQVIGHPMQHRDFTTKPFDVLRNRPIIPGGVDHERAATGVEVVHFAERIHVPLGAHVVVQPVVERTP